MANEKTRKKPRPTNYTYTSEETGEQAFFDCLGELTRACPPADDFFNCVEDAHSAEHTLGQMNLDDYWKGIVLEVAKRCPMILSGDDIHTKLNISVNKVSVTLHGNIGFGFDLTYTVKNGKAEITKCTAIITCYTRHYDLEDMLNESEVWEKREPAANNKKR